MLTQCTQRNLLVNTGIPVHDKNKGVKDGEGGDRQSSLSFTGPSFFKTNNIVS